MAISAKEIAGELHLSPATVSMVLNNKGGISEQTRARVLETAKKRGYDFSKKGRLQTGKGVVQFVVYKEHGTVVADTPFFSQIAEGVDIGCKRAGYELQMTYFYGTQNCAEQVQAIRDRDSRGILLLGTELPPESFRLFASLKVPLVVLDTYFEELNRDSVLINNVQGAYLATSHLAERGLKTVGYLRSSYPIGNFAERADGYYKALRSHKMPTDHPYTHKLTPSVEGSYADMTKILQSGAPVAQGYFADNDLIAAGAMRALQQFGLHIPEDVSLVGFDDMPICEYLEPKLTTMAVPKRRLAELAVRRLVGRIGEPRGIITKTEVSVALAERGSVR